MKHRPRFQGTGRHSHQGTIENAPDDDCPHCREEYLDEHKWELLACLENVIKDLPFVDIETIKVVLDRARGEI